MRFRTAVPMVLLAAACSGDGGQVIAPDPTANFAMDADSLPTLIPGTIVAPLALDLDGAIKALEETVPRRFGNIANRQRIAPNSRMSFAFAVEREPFTVRFRGDTILLSAVIHYQGRGWYDPPIGPDLNGECGTGDHPKPRARLSLRVVPHLTPDWKLRIRSRVARVAPLTDTDRDQCKVTLVKIDVTGKVLTAASNALTKVLPLLQRRLARIDVRTPLEGIWVELQQPIKITDSLWLILHPREVHLGVVHGDTTSVGAEIGVTASPRILSGPKPIVASIPLPPLGPIRERQGFSMLVEGAFDYGVMSAVLTQKLAGKKVRAAGGQLVVRQIRVIGIGGGRLAIGLDFDGSTSGRIWFQGRPQYDPSIDLITVPDLDFDASSAPLLVKGVAWLKGDAIREFLRTQAKLPAGEVMGRVQDLAVKEMNRELARGVRLSAEITSSEPAGILVRQNGLLVRARATGTARLELGAALFAPKDSTP
ncbi:MAG: DUF4403 family protein [Gemmatimonadales bacterium]|nr:DUF4403 family protein [Gemmatimonadales bacterium]